MLRLTKDDGTPIGFLRNDHEFYRYISSIALEENNKRRENHLDSQDIWSFYVLSSPLIQGSIKPLKKAYDESILEQAYHQRLALIERCEGDFKNPWLIPVTPDVDVEHHRKEWCLAYCKKYGITVSELSNKDKERELPAVIRSVAVSEANSKPQDKGGPR